MPGIDRLEQQIQAARVQRSAAAGTAIGEAIAHAWQAVPETARSIARFLRRPKDTRAPERKSLPLPMR